MMQINSVFNKGIPWRQRRMALLGLFLILAVFSVEVLAAPQFTEVGGDIDDDTNWSLANSPYIVVENVRILSSATLTIEPGVVVKFDPGKRLRVAGLITALGTPSNPITFTSNQPDPKPGDWGNIVIVGSSRSSEEGERDPNLTDNKLWYCVVEYAGGTNDGAVRVDSAGAWIDHSTFRYNRQGGIQVVDSGDNTVIVSNNHVHHNYFEESGGGILAVDSQVSGNIVHHNTSAVDGGGIHASEGSLVFGNTVYANTAVTGGGIYADDASVTNNTVVFNKSFGPGAGVNFFGNQTFQTNTIVGNHASGAGVFGGLAIDGDPIFTSNNLYGNTPYDLVHESSNDLNAEGTFWGTSNAGEILDNVYDFLNDNDRGIVDFDPYLDAPDTAAPTPPPLNVTGSFSGGTGSVFWDPIPGSRIYNYHVYYDTDGTDQPYNGTGLTEGASPIDVGTATVTNLNGISPGQLYVAVKASHMDSGESWFSQEVDNQMRKYIPMIILLTPEP